MIVLRNLFSGKISACSFMIAIVLGLYMPLSLFEPIIE